jgi:polyferredoxin
MQNIIVVSAAAIAYIVVGTFGSFWLQRFVEKWGNEYPKRSKVVWYAVSVIAWLLLLMLFPGLFAGGMLTFLWYELVSIVGPPKTKPIDTDAAK